MSQNSNQSFICLMVCQRMNKKLVIEKSENQKLEYFNKHESIKKDEINLTNHTIVKNITTDKKSFDLKEDEETKHNIT